MKIRESTCRLTDGFQCIVKYYATNRIQIISYCYTHILIVGDLRSYDNGVICRFCLFYQLNDRKIRSINNLLLNCTIWKLSRFINYKKYTVLSWWINATVFLFIIRWWWVLRWSCGIWIWFHAHNRIIFAH